MSSIILLGDSITFGAWDIEGGWADRIRKEAVRQNITHNYNPYYEVYNLGIPGNTTDDLKKRIDDEVLRRYSGKDDKIIISIGINDSQYIPSIKSHKITEKVFKENITKLINKARMYTHNILLVGLTTIDDDRAATADWLIDSMYKNEYAQIYNEILKSVVLEEQINFIEIFNNFLQEMEHIDLFEDDGIHPNTNGHKLLFELIRKSIF